MAKANLVAAFLVVDENTKMASTSLILIRLGEPRAALQWKTTLCIESDCAVWHRNCDVIKLMSLLDYPL